MRTQLLVLGALGHAGTWVAPGKGQGDDLGDLVQVDARLVTGFTQESCPLCKGSLAGRLVRLAVTGTCGAELAEHDRF